MMRAIASLDGLRDRRVVVAWSGGRDSTVLLHMVRARGIDALAVHVDHQMRPSSTRDAAFCARLARRWGVPLELVRLDIDAPGSAQEWARVQRYATLARCAREADASVVLTAHHGQDALETALLNRDRGGGLFGATSLLRRHTRGPIPSWPQDLGLQRPLLSLLRADVGEYARKHGLSWVEDPTNTSSTYRRNEIRHAVIPNLTTDGVSLEDWLEVLESMALDADDLARQARSALEHVSLAPLDADSLVMQADGLSDTPRPILARALIDVVRSIGCALGPVHVDQLCDAIETSRRARLSIPGGVATLEDGLLFVERARGRGGRHLADRTAPPVAITCGEARTIPWLDTDIQVRPAASGVQPDLNGDRLVVSGGASRTSRTRIPTPLRWRWPRLVANEQSLALSDTPILASGPDGAYVEISWNTDPNSVWRHLA